MYSIGELTKIRYGSDYTVKFLNFWKPENIAVITLWRKRCHRVMCPKDRDGMAYSVDPDGGAV